MKKFYLIATAVTMLTACTNSEKMTADFSNDDPVMIGFETFHEKSTKVGAIESPENLTDVSGGFGVWGYKGSATDIKTYGNDDPSNDMDDLDKTAKFTNIFNNVKVWYESKVTYDTDKEHYHFTYAVPKYWDKKSEYVFFAYAPWDETHATLSKKGIITISNIPGIQDVSKYSQSDEEKLSTRIYANSNTASVTDYLMAKYETDQRYDNSPYTNQHEKNYSDAEQTVGFTFGHMLSKLQVNVMANTQYSGVKEMIVNYLSIENMPALGTDVEQTTFTQKSPTTSEGTYSPTYYAKNLQIINNNNTENANANATSQTALYVLYDGSLNATTHLPEAPSPQTQSFNYYVAPNNPANNTTEANKKHLLNISYTIEYVDGIKEDVILEDIDLSPYLSEMVQNNSYILNIKIALNEILFTASVTPWANSTTTEISVP